MAAGLSDASIAVTTFAAGTFFMAVPPVLSDLVSAPNAPNWGGRGREDRRSKFYEVSDNLAVNGGRVQVTALERQVRRTSTGIGGSALHGFVRSSSFPRSSADFRR